jgi:hypothetical protein
MADTKWLAAEDAKWLKSAAERWALDPRRDTPILNALGFGGPAKLHAGLDALAELVADPDMAPDEWKMVSSDGHVLDGAGYTLSTTGAGTRSDNRTGPAPELLIVDDPPPPVPTRFSVRVRVEVMPETLEAERLVDVWRAFSLDEVAKGDHLPVFRRMVEDLHAGLDVLAELVAANADVWGRRRTEMVEREEEKPRTILVKDRWSESLIEFGPGEPERCHHHGRVIGVPDGLEWRIGGGEWTSESGAGVRAGDVIEVREARP